MWDTQFLIPYCILSFQTFQCQISNSFLFLQTRIIAVNLFYNFVNVLFNYLFNYFIKSYVLYNTCIIQFFCALLSTPLWPSGLCITQCCME